MGIIYYDIYLHPYLKYQQVKQSQGKSSKWKKLIHKDGIVDTCDMHRQTWILVLLVSFTSCVTLDKLFNFPMPQFLQL